MINFINLNPEILKTPLHDVFLKIETIKFNFLKLIETVTDQVDKDSAILLQSKFLEEFNDYLNEDINFYYTDNLLNSYIFPNLAYFNNVLSKIETYLLNVNYDSDLGVFVNETFNISKNIKFAFEKNGVLLCKTYINKFLEFYFPFFKYEVINGIDFEQEYLEIKDKYVIIFNTLTEYSNSVLNLLSFVDTKYRPKIQTQKDYITNATFVNPGLETQVYLDLIFEELDKLDVRFNKFQNYINSYPSIVIYKKVEEEEITVSKVWVDPVTKIKYLAYSSEKISNFLTLTFPIAQNKYDSIVLNLPNDNTGLLNSFYLKEFQHLQFLINSFSEVNTISYKYFLQTQTPNILKFILYLIDNHQLKGMIDLNANLTDLYSYFQNEITLELESYEY
jgi:hypothetical protein